MNADRHSSADPIELITDPEEKARREAENGIRQFNAALTVIRTHISNPDKAFRLNQALIVSLHREALDGIHPLAGTYRNSPVSISNNGHFPPPHVEVPDLVAEMCDYVNRHWDERAPFTWLLMSSGGCAGYTPLPMAMAGPPGPCFTSCSILN